MKSSFMSHHRHSGKQLGYLKRPGSVAPLCRKIIEAALSATHRNRNAKTTGSTGATGEQKIQMAIDSTNANVKTSWLVKVFSVYHAT